MHRPADASQARREARNGYYSARLTFRDAVIQLVSTGLAKNQAAAYIFDRPQIN